MIEIRQTPFGRGIFATEDIPSGTIVERSPLITFEYGEYISKTLDDYVFFHGDQKCLCLGMGSLFNHNNGYNIDTKFGSRENFNNSTHPGFLEFIARRDITRGEELCIYYGDGWWEKRNTQNIS